MSLSTLAHLEPDSSISLSQNRAYVTQSGEFPLLTWQSPPATVLFFPLMPNFHKEQIHSLTLIAHFPFTHQPIPTDFLQLLLLNLL